MIKLKTVEDINRDNVISIISTDYSGEFEKFVKKRKILKPNVCLSIKNVLEIWKPRSPDVLTNIDNELIAMDCFEIDCDFSLEDNRLIIYYNICLALNNISNSFVIVKNIGGNPRTGKMFVSLYKVHM